MKVNLNKSIKYVSDNIFVPLGKRFKCVLCDEEFKFVLNFKQHLRDVHNQSARDIIRTTMTQEKLLKYTGIDSVEYFFKAFPEPK